MPANPELDDAVRRIVELMLKDEWRVGESHLEFSRKYGVTTATVRDWASHASRFIRLCAGSEDEIRDELLRNVRRIGGKAEDAGEYRDALGAQELRLRVHGFLDRKPPEERDEPVPVEQLAAALRQLGHEVKLNVRPESTPPGAADDADTERPGKERVEGFLEGEGEPDE